MSERLGAAAALVLTLGVSSVWGLWLGMNRITDPFLYFDIGFIQSVESQSHLLIPTAGPFASLNLAPGRPILLAQLVGMMGIDATTLQFLPIGSLAVSAAVFLFSLRLLASPWLACLGTLSLMLNLSHAAALYSVFPYALALPLFFAFVVIAMRYVRTPSIRDVFLLLLLFVAAQLIHYTIAVWFILFLAGTGIVFLVHRRRARDRPSPTPAPRSAGYLVLAATVIFLWFNETLYRSFLPLIGPEALEGAIHRFASYLSLSPTDVSPYVFDRAPSLGIVTAIPIALLLVIVTFGLARALASVVRNKDLTSRELVRPAVLVGAAVLAFVDSVAYAVRGSVSTKAFSILLPPFAIYEARRAGGFGLGVVVAMTLLGMSVAKAGFFYSESYVIAPRATSASSEEIVPSAKWLNEKAHIQPFTVLADLSLYGKFLVGQQFPDPSVALQGFTLARFQWLVGDGQHPEPGDAPDFVAIDLTSTEPTTGFVWLLLDPIRRYDDTLRANPEVNWVYDDGTVLVGRPGS